MNEMYADGQKGRQEMEYGTDADLKSFVKTAHGLNLKVMVDLVYAHAGPSFGKRHPDYVLVDEAGRMKLSSYKFCLLNFDSPGAVVIRALEHHDSANDMYYARVEKISSAKCEAVYVLCYAVDGVPFLCSNEARNMPPMAI